MPIMMYNGVPYGSLGVEIVSLTYAEYEALTEAQKMDASKVYDITDMAGGVVFGNTDISKIGDGTVTGAIAALNGNLKSVDISSEIKLNSDFSFVSNVDAKKCGKIITLSLSIKSDTRSDLIDLLVASIPKEYIPSKPVLLYGLCVSGLIPVQCYVSKDYGGIRFGGSNTSSYPKGKEIYIVGSWCLD